MQSCGAFGCVYYPPPRCLSPPGLYRNRGPMVMKCIKNPSQWPEEMENEQTVSRHIRWNWISIVESAGLPDVRVERVFGLAIPYLFCRQFDIRDRPLPCKSDNHAFYDYAGSSTVQQQIEALESRPRRSIHLHDWVYMVAIVLRLLISLTLLQSLNVLHGDLHDGNVVIGDRDGMPRIVDWGNAEVVSSSGSTGGYTSMVFALDALTVWSSVVEPLISEITEKASTPDKEVLITVLETWPNTDDTDAVDRLNAERTISAFTAFLTSNGAQRFLLR
jgi:hypothetical protein